jgi:NADH-quinone oxidoreductase subunit J
VEILLFVVLGGVAVAAAVGVVLSKSPVHSALFLLLNFATLAVFYVVLNAQFLAVAQVTVYAGAIVVLFLFVIMLIGGPVGHRMTPGRPIARVAAIALSLVFLVALAYGVASGTLGGGRGPATEDAIAQVGNVQALGQALYTDFLLPVELVSILLLVGMVGAVALARKPSVVRQDKSVPLAVPAVDGGSIRGGETVAATITQPLPVKEPVGSKPGGMAP